MKATEQDYYKVLTGDKRLYSETQKIAALRALVDGGYYELVEGIYVKKKHVDDVKRQFAKYNSRCKIPTEFIMYTNCNKDGWYTGCYKFNKVKEMEYKEKYYYIPIKANGRAKRTKGCRVIVTNYELLDLASDGGFRLKGEWTSKSLGVRVYSRDEKLRFEGRTYLLINDFEVI